VAMYQYIRITVCGDVSVCSDYSMWRCIGMFGLKYVAMYRYVRLVRRGARSVYPVIIFGKMSVCQDYILMARCQYVQLQRHRPFYVIQIKTLSLWSLL